MTNPTVTIDARMLGPHGIGAYIRDLLENFASMDHEFRFRVICANGNLLNHLPRTKFQFIAASSPIYGLREQWEILRLARNTDLLHCPHYNIPYGYRGRLVVTIHDLTHLVCREFLPNKVAYLYARFMLSAAARHAARIITVSRFSARAIQERLAARPEKIRVIYRALREQFGREGATSNTRRLQEMGISKPYALFVGVLKPHKNVQALLRAFALLPSELRSSYQVVIAGKLDSYYVHLLRLTKELSLNGQVVFAGQVSDDDLHALYAGATLFVLPSLNEGFGLPVLEAMAYGLPVIASNASSLPEVVGDAGRLVDPHDERSIARAMEELLRNEELRKALGERSKERAELFSARKFALEHLEVYRAALG